jgi:hypothetical protein
MSERACSALRAALTAGERLDRLMAGHLESCAECRQEATRLERLLVLLRAEASVEPPPGIDAAVRDRIASRGVAARGPIRPFLATGLAAAALLALVSGVAAALAQFGAAEHGPGLAVTLFGTYLAISAAATLPLLHLRTRRISALREVRR